MPAPLTQAKQNLILVLLRQGHSVRAIAHALDHDKMCIHRYRKMFKEMGLLKKSKCFCGRRAGHMGTCWKRFTKWELKKELMSIAIGGNHVVE